MLAILKAYTDIALLRRGPDSLPYSPPLLLLTLIVLGTMETLVPPAPLFTMAQSGIISAVDIIMTCSVIWLMLNAIGRLERFVQTATALFGAKLVLSAMQLLVQLPAGGAYDPQTQEGVPSILLLQTLVELWFYIVMSMILRIAMSIGVLQSIGLILLITMLKLGALQLLLPGLGPAA